ncbi:MAG TPA: ornithine carbamoyltransferase [Solirubrobacterales bacterium]|nr:ornithine carbamoyltransferase [Solirubrobacterales bacterium]
MATQAPARTGHRDFLQVTDLNRMSLEGLLGLAESMKLRPGALVDTHRGKAVACFFNKPSTRTRVSFEAAAYRLGMLPIMLRPDELQLGRGEPIADTARVLSSYTAAIVIRTFAQAEVEEVAAAASVPVINALTDEHHPCQALADLLTLREHFGRLEGLRLAYVGDGNNVAHSLLQAAAMVGISVTIATPPGYRPNEEIVAKATEVALVTGGKAGTVLVTGDPEEAVRGAHAVYTDVWVSMGEEAGREQRLRDLEPFRVDPRLMALAREDAVFMHCLPAHRGEEVDASVIDGPRSVVFQQAANRLPTEQAILATLIGGR